MKFCYECGCKLEIRKLEGEGEVPYCPGCKAFRFPIFNTAISTEVLNKDKNKILLIQQYGKRRYVLVAGYVNKGESAEETLVREVKEELGLCVLEQHFVKSEYFQPSNTLMLNFSCVVDSENLNRINKEVDLATWFTVEEAKKNVFHDSLAERFLLAYLKGQK